MIRTAPKLPRAGQWLLALLLLTTVGVLARGQQSAARPDRGTMPNGSYSVSNIESISLQNGNVNLSIPLAALPPIAGGKLSWALSAQYNSKLWNMVHSQNDADDGAWHPFNVDMPQLSELGGWRVNGQYQITIRNAHEDYDYLTDIPLGSLPSNEYSLLANYYWYKVVLTTPDGAEHELRPMDYSAAADGTGLTFLHGYYNTSPYQNSAMRYYSFDGSYIYAQINTNGTSWTVVMPDGTKVIQTTDGIQRIQDTNGNKIKIFTETDGADYETHYQDEQTDREIRYSYTAGTGGQGQGQVWYQTVGGTWMHIDINFGTTTVQGQVYRVNDWPADQLHGCTHFTELYQEIPVIREIIFPVTETGQTQRQFSFTYNSDTTESATTSVNWTCNATESMADYTRTASRGWGSLNQVTMPSGAVIDYSYSLDSGPYAHAPFTTDHIPGETVTQKQLTHDGASDIWAYAIDYNSHGGAVTNPDGSTTTQTQYSHDGAYAWGYGKAGLSYRIQQPFMMVEKHWSDVIFSGASLSSPGGPVNFNPVVDAEYTTLLDAGGNALKMSAKTYQLDYNGSVTQTTEYDWFDPALVSRDAQGVPTGVPGGATVLRTTSNTFYNPATSASSSNVYSNRSLSTGLPLILNALQQTTTGAAIAQFSYDGNSYGTSPTSGNLTSKSVWDDLDNKWITASTAYNSYGNVTSATDPRGKVTTFYYDDSTHAVPNRVVVDPQNGTGTQIATTVFDFSTGLVTSATDANGQTSSIDYTNQLLNSVDPFGRPGISIGPLVNAAGTNQHHKVTTTYEDHLFRVTVATDLYAEGDKLLKTRTTTDMLGRAILSEQTEDGANYSIYARKAYDVVNRISYYSGPMKGTPGSPVSNSTDSWTRVTNDIAGRAIEVATFGGASQPPATGTTSVTGFTGTVTSAYEANFTTVTDQAGKQRRSKTDALGRLVRVDEPNDSGSLGTTSSPTQDTIYAYDVFGNLLTVTQGTQTPRAFTYDSLSRLRTAANPESGTIGYTYDDNGNLLTKTDARSIVSTYVYDSLNRATSRSYSDSTPTVSYVYDTLSQNGKGRLTSVSSSVSSYSYSGYDATGKVQGGSQTIGSQTYSLSYGYDLSGHVTSMTYPSGRVVNYNYDNAGRLADKDSTHLAFTGNLGDGTTRTYAKGISYGSMGQMTQEQFGTTTAVYNKLIFNSRGQLAEILASTSGGDTTFNRGKIVNDYNGTDNNGNLLRQTVYVPNNDANTSPTSWYQQYEYDYLNRLKRVHEYTGNTSIDWQQEFVYDRWANRTIDQNTSHTFGAEIPKPEFTVSTSNNRMGVPSGQTGSMAYDSAGNLTTDTYSAAAVTRVYDAENRMTSETQASNYVAGTYSYDGDGRRVKRVVGGVETWQVYGLGGELLAEYAANASATNAQKEYGYRNGQLLVTATATSGWGAAPTIHDNPLVVNETTLQARHITELRTAIDALRSHMSMSAFSWQYSVTTSDWITASPILEMRTALDEALGAPSPSYAVGLAQSEPIKAIHIQELRDRVLAAWSSGSSTQINWLVADQLGTPRMIFDQTGSLANVSRHDYLPFGEELATQGLRLTVPGYSSSDNIRQKFTQKERDNETGLDYFLARYYSSAQGRFTSPDPLLSSGRPAVPESWNRYTYVLNNPLVLVDPDGLDWGVTEWDDKKGHHTNYHWFDGKIGKHDGRTYTAVNFGGAGSLDVPTDDGQIVRISNRGFIRQIIYTGPGGDGPSNGQGNPLNMSAGLVDGAIPFGKEIREAAFGEMGVDTSAPEYQNAAMISAGVTIGVSLLSGAGEVKIAGCLVEVATPTRIYSARTLLRSAEDHGPMHNFPESFNTQIFQGSRTVTRDFFKVDRQALSNDSIMYRAPGSINGKAGTFEIGVRPSVSGRTEVITHRFFRPGP